MPPPVQAAFTVYALTADGQKTNSIHGASYDEPSAVTIAIAEAARWQRSMGVYQTSDGALRAFVGQFYE
jgi:hypothetical protein